MADVQPILSAEDTLEQILSKARVDAHESLSGLWDELTSRVQQHFHEALAERARTSSEHGAGRVRRQFSGQLTQALRRLLQFEDDARWSSALLDSTTALCDRAALFTVNSGVLQLRAVRGIVMAPDFPDLPLDQAPAFANVAQTRDTVVALRSAGELSAAFAAIAEENPDRRCWLFPVQTRDRLAAILYADAEEHIEIEALELVTTMAGLVLDTLPAQSQLLTIAPTPALRPHLSPADAALHFRAERFARVETARLLLQREDAVRTGRGEHDVYSHLKPEIDSVRNAFRRDFLDASPTMVDYLHREFLHTLANDDANLAGPDYPGAMA